MNPVESAKMRYIAMHFHAVRERVQAEQLRVLHVRTHLQLADCFTKALSAPLLIEARMRLNLR